MSATKCPQCGLVNFSTALQCKRCQLQLNEFAPIAEQRSYQTGMPEVQPATAFHQSQRTSFRAFQAPPPPPPMFDNAHVQQSFEQPAMSLYCVKCAGRNDVYMQNFKKDYVPPSAYLGIFLGLLPMIILVLVLRVSHHLSAPFCDRCWTNFCKVKKVETGVTLGFFAILVVGGMMAANTNGSAPLIFFICFVLAIGLVVWGHIFKINNSPKYKRVSRQQVIIDDPTYGEVLFQK